LPGDTELERYLNALHDADVSLGTLADGLRQRGLRESTLWIILGDHGEAFGQHEGNVGHTFFLYDENVHVPFIVAAPGLLQTQRRVQKVVSLVDTAPTMLDLLGVSPPEEYQGRSALDDTPEMALFFADYSIGMLGLRDQKWKFIYELDSGRSKLFDLNLDPFEKSDRSSEHPDRTRWYRQNLQQWSAAQKSLLTEPRLQQRTGIPRSLELRNTP
jgi:arylsulfatase A-like enzyme